MRNIDKYRNAFIVALDLDEEDICEELALGVTREWDSIGHMTLISEIEDSFNIIIDSEWITEFNSYQSGIELLTQLGVNFINE